MAKPLSEVRKKGQPWGCAVPFFLVFFAAGIALAWGVAVRPLVGAARARFWAEHPCVVLSSEVDSHSDSDGTTYKVAIRYSYVVRGTRYESRRYDFVNVYSSGHESKARVVARYPAGAETTCWVNPSNPAEAVLFRGVTSAHLLFMLFPLPFAGVGAGGLVWAFRSMRKAKEAGASRAAPGTVETCAGPVVLAAESSPRRKHLALLGVTGCWNGFVGLVIVLALSEPDPISTGSKVFIGVLALIGLGLLAWLLGPSRRAAQNPRPVLTLERTPAVGETVRLSFELLGRTSLLRGLRIDLEGREIARFTRGTDTVTETAVFHRAGLFSTGDPLRMGEGAAPLPIPAGLVPSLSAENNEVSWRLRVVGETTRPPRLEADFPLLVAGPEVKP